MNTEHLSIRAGRTFTHVLVCHQANCCRVATSDATRRRNANALTYITVEGVGERSIKRAANDCAGQGYRTLTALMADVDPEITIRRAREYDI